MRRNKQLKQLRRQEQVLIGKVAVARRRNRKLKREAEQRAQGS